METHPPYWDKFPNLTFFLKVSLIQQVRWLKSAELVLSMHTKGYVILKKTRFLLFDHFSHFSGLNPEDMLCLCHILLFILLYFDSGQKSIDVQILTINVYCLSQLCLLKTHFVLAYNNLYTLSQSNWVLCYSASILSDPLWCRPSTSLYINKLQLKYRLTCISSCKFRSNQKNVNFSLTPLKVKIKVEPLITSSSWTKKN